MDAPVKRKKVAGDNSGTHQTSFKHIEKAKESRAEGLVFSVFFRELPPGIKTIEGRKILYQRPVGNFSDVDYLIVFFVPKKEVGKLKDVISDGKKIYEICDAPHCDGEDKPHYFRVLAGKGLYLKETNL